LYTIRLSASHKDTFYLEPCKAYEQLGISKVEFRCKNATARADWFMAITKALKEHELEKNDSPRLG
jgi:hypothetical protein